MRIAIAPPEGELVIHLEKIGHAQFPPGVDQPFCDILIGLATRGIQLNPVSGDIHDVETIEFAISFDIPGTHQICLMETIGTKGFQLWIWCSLGHIRELFRH